MIARFTLYILFVLLLCWLSPAQVLATSPDCDSCRYVIQALDKPFNLNGNWLFTREDHLSNKNPDIDTSSWKIAQTPGQWKKIYDDGLNYRIGWYRGMFQFAPEIIGQEVELLLDVYMSRLQVYLDGELIYQRQGAESGKRYYSIQPIPIRFTVSKKIHHLAFRVDSLLMTGIYQGPFELRQFKSFDLSLTLYHLWGGEFRFICGHVLFFFGLFFLTVYYKTRFVLYLLAGLANISVYHFLSLPGDFYLTLFHPERLLILHYFGVIWMTHFNALFAQYFSGFQRGFNYFSTAVYGVMTLFMAYLVFDINLDIFITVRSVLLIYCFINALLHMALLLPNAIRKVKYARTVMLGLTCISVSGCHDVFLALGMIDSIALFFFGALLSCFCILWVASSIFSSTFLENKKLVTVLQEKNVRILEQVGILTQLNQVGARMAALYELKEVLDYAQISTEHLLRAYALVMYTYEAEKHKLLYCNIGLDPQGPLMQAAHQAAIVTTNSRQILYLHDLTEVSEFPLPTPLHDAQSLLAVPLMDKLEVKWVMVIFAPKNTMDINSEYRQLAETIASFVGVTLKKLQLLEDTRHSARMENELLTAAAVQQALFPKTLPKIRNLELASFFQSASETGGDWYGFITQMKDYLYIMIGDVTGHGTPAALVTATASATCKVLEEMYLKYNHPLTSAEFMRQLNFTVYDTGWPDFLMTFFIARIDLKTGEMQYTNAGHNFPIRVQRNGRTKKILNANSRLGCERDLEFTHESIWLEAGDLLLFYTDGLTENSNRQGKMWGERKLSHFLRDQRHLPVNEIVTTLVQKIYDFIDGNPLEDDMTMVACKVLEPFYASRRKDRHEQRHEAQQELP